MKGKVYVEVGAGNKGLVYTNFKFEMSTDISMKMSKKWWSVWNSLPEMSNLEAFGEKLVFKAIRVNDAIHEVGIQITMSV